MLKAAKPDDGPWIKLWWGALDGSGHQEKPEARLRLVRLAKEPRSGPSLKGSCRQARNHRDLGIVIVPKRSAAAETKPVPRHPF
jgi:hypothetical protein